MTPMRRKFADEYLKDHNGPAAAIRAGYSAVTAYAQASRILKDPQVKEYIEKREEKRSAKRQKAAEQALPPIEEVFEFWVTMMRDVTTSSKDRLRASENIARAQGAFVENVKMDMTADINQTVAISESDRALMENLQRRLKDG